jgi:hypothetical protein
MATTAVVNPRRNRKGQFVKGGHGRRRNPSRKHSRRRRRRNYGAAAEVNPRRRRRHYGSGGGRRRRNPISPYAYRGYRYTNPGVFDMDEITETVPAATAGIWAARFAVRQAGNFEAGSGGVPEPGIKHALAIWAAAHFGSGIIGDLLGSPEKGRMARIAAFGYGGDLFLRERFMRDSKFVAENISLKGIDDEESGDYVAGMGAPTMVDAWGNKYVSTPAGWQLSGDEDVQYVQDAAGNLYALSGGDAGGARLAGFETQSPIAGFATQSPISGNFGAGGSSFGYSRM